MPFSSVSIAEIEQVNVSWEWYIITKSPLQQRNEVHWKNYYQYLFVFKTKNVITPIDSVIVQTAAFTNGFAWWLFS